MVKWNWSTVWNFNEIEPQVCWHHPFVPPQKQQLDRTHAEATKVNSWIGIIILIVKTSCLFKWTLTFELRPFGYRCIIHLRSVGYLAAVGGDKSRPTFGYSRLPIPFVDYLNLVPIPILEFAKLQIVQSVGCASNTMAPMSIIHRNLPRNKVLQIHILRFTKSLKQYL